MGQEEEGIVGGGRDNGMLRSSGRRKSGDKEEGQGIEDEELEGGFQTAIQA